MRSADTPEGGPGPEGSADDSTEPLDQARTTQPLDETTRRGDATFGASATPGGEPRHGEPLHATGDGSAAGGAQEPPRGWQPPPPPPAWGPPPPSWGPPSSGFFDSMRRTGIWRGQDRWIGGVAAGVARRLDVDPLLIRGLLVVISLFGGLGLLLYGIAWALLPEEADGRIHLQEAARGNVDAALAGALAMTVVGLTRPGTWWDGWWFVSNGFSFTVLVLGVIAVVVLGIVAVSRRSPTPPPQPSPGGPPPDWSARASAPGPSTPRTATPSTAGPAAPPWASMGGPAPAPQPVPQTYRAPVPPRPVTPGPGHVTVTVVLAVCLLAVAGVLVWDRTDPLGWLLPLVLGGVVLTLLGLGVMLAGSRGRRGGTLSVLGVLLALLVAPATLATSAAPPDLGLSSSARIGDRTAAPTTVAQAESGYELLAGDLRLDLTEVPLDVGAVSVPVDVGAGDVRVTVPDAAVEVQVELAAGRVQSLAQPGWTGSGTAVTRPLAEDSRTPVTWANGTGITTTLRSPDAGDDEPDLVVVVRAGAGSILIEEES